MAALDSLQTLARCEASGCSGIATHAYGPECEAENLMYVCARHAKGIEAWREMHGDETLTCDKHGALGKTRDATILVPLPKQTIVI